MKKIISIGIAALFALVPLTTLEASTSKNHKSHKAHKKEEKQASDKKSHKKHSRTAKTKSRKSHRSVQSGDWKYTKTPKDFIQKVKDVKNIRDLEPISEKLHAGMTNSLFVAEAQAVCVKLGYLPAYRVDKKGNIVSNIDGNYGGRTYLAFELLQKPYKIKGRGRFVNHYTRRVLNYVIASNGKLPPAEGYSIPEIQNVTSTYYFAGERHSDKYTDSRKSATNVRLAVPTPMFAGVAGTDPEVIEWGSKLIIETDKGILQYIAGDTGTAVIDMIASHGKTAIVDLYGTEKIVGTMSIVWYQGKTAFQDLPHDVKQEMFRLQNWHGYTFVMPNHLNQYDQLVAKR